MEKGALKEAFQKMFEAGDAQAQCFMGTGKFSAEHGLKSIGAKVDQAAAPAATNIGPSTPALS